MEMEKLLAKALYDNTAECPDELPFRKGDIVTVMEQNVDGTPGWWKCSLHGRQGLAPANRLHLLPPSQTETFSQVGLQTLYTERSLSRSRSPQNVYQTPSVHRMTPSQTYEPMDRLYKVPFSPTLCYGSPENKTTDLWKQKYPSVEAGGKVSPSKVPQVKSITAEVYDVPTQPRRALFTESNQQPASQKKSLVQNSKSERKDANYDIPVPMTTENGQGKVTGGCNTLPTPRKSEWVYDVPLTPEKYYGTMLSTSKGHLSQMYDMLPPRATPKQSADPILQAYDIPTPSSSSKPRQNRESPLNMEDKGLVYDVPLGLKRQGTAVYGGSQRSNTLPPAARQQQGTAESVGDLMEPQPTCVDGGQQGGRQSDDLSSSFKCSSESATPTSSSPEPVREVTLTQEEASQHLAELQEAVCQAVPRLMVFVSSHWRTREHLTKHIQEIQAAAEGIADAMGRFVEFTLDVRGNTLQLSDANLQLRLHRQLSIVKDSGLILQEVAEALAGEGWQLNTLVQDSTQEQMPDQLDRFVMVARRVPEDVRYLVSILNANGKLLFRQPQKDSQWSQPAGRSEMTNSQVGEKQISYSTGEDNDYVHLQTKMEFEKQQRLEQESQKPQQVAVNRSHGLSEHCRLYFGALQKAISVFVLSLQEGQPPESFIDKGKLVIMVGQKLVDTLCREAHGQGAKVGQDLLCKGNHLCALLKQLAVATKKAAVHFPEQKAMQEVQDFAKELAQRAQHFRSLLDQSVLSRE